MFPSLHLQLLTHDASGKLLIIILSHLGRHYIYPIQILAHSFFFFIDPSEYDFLVLGAFGAGGRRGYLPFGKGET